MNNVVAFSSSKASSIPDKSYSADDRAEAIINALLENKSLYTLIKADNEKFWRETLKNILVDVLSKEDNKKRFKGSKNIIELPSKPRKLESVNNKDLIVGIYKITNTLAFENYLLNKGKVNKVWLNKHVKYAFDILRFMNFEGCPKGIVYKTFIKAYEFSLRRKNSE